jgi:hypothetical protein
VDPTTSRLLPVTFVLLLLISSFALNAQENGQEPAGGLLDPADYLALTVKDIQTADLYQLADWCRILSIDHRGSIEALRNRLYRQYGFTAPAEAGQSADESQRITIRAADSTRYFTLESSTEGYVEISGGVQLELYSPAEGSRHTIEADRLLYNQTTGDISASGSVRYSLEEGDNKEETFYGESLTVNLGSWESRFLKGYTLQNRSIDEREIVFSFYGETIGRSANEIISLRDGRITSSTMRDPSYSITAKQIRVYEPGEWLLDGATFYLGRVPVLVFPFFFQLRDKMLINPSFGFDLVDGAFMQTSTYFFGAGGKSDQESLSFLQLTEEEDAGSVTEIRGLYRRTKKNPTPAEIAAARRAQEKEEYGRVILDYYNRRGLAAALDLSRAGGQMLERIDFFAGLGITRMVSGFYPYQFRWDDPDKLSSAPVWEGGWIGGIYVPFRYLFSLTLTGSMERMDYSLSLPFNSDPRIDLLYDNRRESIDWGELLAITGEADTTSSDTLPDGFDWTFSSSYRADTSKLTPWISEARIQELSSSLEWQYGTISGSTEIEELLPSYDALPAYLQEEYSSRYFPYPDTLLLPKLDIVLSGSLIPPVGKGAADSGIPEQEGAGILPPWESEERVEKQTPGDELLVPPGRMPELGISLNADEDKSGTLTYRLNPRLIHGISFDSYRWEEGLETIYSSPEQVDLDPAYTLTTVSGDARLTYSDVYFDRVWSIEDSLGITFQEKQRVLTVDSSIDTWDSLTESDRQGSYQRLSHSLRLYNRPFLHSAVPVDQLFEYRLQHYLYTREYETAEGFRTDLFPWERSTIQTQQVSSTTGFDLGDFPQTLYLSSSVPPLLGNIDGSYTSEMGALLAVAAGGLEEIEEGRWEPKDATVDLRYNFSEYSFLRQQLLFEESADRSNFRLREGESEGAAATEDNGYGLSGRLDYWIDREDGAGRNQTVLPERLYLRGWLKEFWSSYTMEYLYPVSLVPGVGWDQSSEQKFIPSEFSFGYAREFTPEPRWKRRVELSYGIDTGYTQDLNRYSDTSFFFKTSLNLGVYQFLDLNFSSYSENTSAFRYLPWIVDDTAIEPVNPLEDLLRSFNIFNPAERRASSFNLRSIALKAVHHLDQWDLTVEYTGEPVKDTQATYPTYRWESNFSIYVQWNPIPELKQEVAFSDGELILE